MKKLPLISCLCITRNKIPLLKRAIHCFKEQTYPNKELVLVFEDNDTDTKNFVKRLRDKNISIYEIPSTPKLSLGELRNISIHKCKGEYFCQWDADDWYHNRRLETQMNCILSMHKPACMLTYWIIFDSTTQLAYLSQKRIWEGSILCKTSLVADNTIEYKAITKKEDYYFTKKILAKNVVYPVDLPHLYIYVYHSNNTWNYEHFKTNFELGKQLSKEVSLTIQSILEGKYSHSKASKLLNSASILGEMDYKYHH